MNWIPFDRKKPPPEGRYLVTDGQESDVFTLKNQYGNMEWVELKVWLKVSLLRKVTHYAVIHLPRG